MSSLKLYFAPDIRDRRRCSSYGAELFVPVFSAVDLYSAPQICAGGNGRRASIWDEKCSARSSARLNRIGVLGLPQIDVSSPASEIADEQKLETETEAAAADGYVISAKSSALNLSKLRKAVLGENSSSRDGRKTKEIHGDPVKKARSKFVRETDLEGSAASLSQDRCNSILNRLERESDEKTLKFFDFMRLNGKLVQNSTAYTLALRALIRSGDWIPVEALLQEMTSSGCALTGSVFNSLLLVCNKRGIAEIGTKLFQMMLDLEIQPNESTFAMLMTLHQKSNNLSEAELTFNRMRTLKIKCVVAYSAMITIYTRNRQFYNSELIINLMEEDQIHPNLENWLVRMNAYSQQGKLQHAESLLESMKEAGFSPNIVAYNTLITGYGKISDSNSAKRLFQDLQSLRIKPDATTYRSMIEGLGRGGNYPEAKKFYSKLKASGFRPNSSNFYTMINLQAKNWDDEAAVQTLRDMRSAGCELPSILGILLQAYDRAGRTNEIPRKIIPYFLNEILSDQTCCSILVLAYVEASLLDDALAVLRQRKWVDPSYEDNLYHLVICSCKEAGNYETAETIFKQMLELKSDPNLHISSSMIDIYGCMGKFREAEELYLKLEASGVTLDMVAYSIVVRMYVKAGSLSKASKVLESLEKRRDIVPDVFLYRDMLRIYQRCNMTEKLAEVYYTMRRGELVWDEAIYNCVVNCCAKALPVDEISRLFDEMLGLGFLPSSVTFNVMMNVFCKAGLLHKGRKVFSLARKQGLADVISYNIIIAAYGQAGEFARMEHVVGQMRLAGYPVSLEAYNAMLDAYGKNEKLEEFNSVLEKMKEVSCESDHYTYNILINIYGRKGWIKEVGGVLAELRGRGLELDLYSYNTLIKAYGISGMVEEAVDLVREMRARGIEPDRVTYSTLVSALQRNEEFLEAVKWSLWMKQVELQG